jgi:oligopeptide transport system substrate-binding protein
MQNVKKILALVLVVVMIAAMFAACKPEEKPTTTGNSVETQPKTEPKTEPSETKPVDNTDEPVTTTEPVVVPTEPVDTHNTVDTYSTTASFNITSLDYLYDNKSSNGDFTANFTEGLLTQDSHGKLVPGMATEWSHNEDASEWYFTVRDDAVWTTASGEEYDVVKAEDFVTGLKRAADSKSLVLGLVKPLIKGLAEYADGTGSWEDVGITVDGNKLTYTLTGPCGYFDGLTTYNILRPVNEEFLESKGDEFGAVEPDGILYNGCYLLSSLVPNQEVRLEANPNYYDKDNVHVKHVVIAYNDGKDPMLNFNMYVNGEVSTTGISMGNPEMVSKANELFADNMYKSMTTSTSYWGAFNWDRQSYALWSNPDRSTTAKTSDQQKADTHTAILNANFRLGVYSAFSEKAYYEVALGDIAEDRARNTLVPYTFSVLSTGETYGALVTKYLEQENPAFQGIDLNDGQDAWYNPQRAASFMEKAKAELGDSVKEWPVHLDVIEDGTDEQGKNMALAMKAAIEGAIGDYVVIDLVFLQNYDEVLDSYYNVENGEDNSMDLAFGAGWGPDYGDPYTYIHCFDPDNGDMLLYSGITPKITEDTERPESQTAAIEAMGLNEIKELMDKGNAAFGDERIDLFAQVEAKLLAYGILRPFATRGAGIVVSNVKPFSAAYGLYGQASTNAIPYFKYMVVYDEPVTADEYYAAKEAWLAGN